MNCFKFVNKFENLKNLFQKNEIMLKDKIKKFINDIKYCALNLQIKYSKKSSFFF